MSNLFRKLYLLAILICLVFYAGGNRPASAAEIATTEAATPCPEVAQEDTSAYVFNHVLQIYGQTPYAEPQLHLFLPQPTDWNVSYAEGFTRFTPSRGQKASDLWVAIVPYSTPEDVGFNEHFYDTMRQILSAAGLSTSTKGRYYGGEYSFTTADGGSGAASLLGNYAYIRVTTKPDCSTQIADFFAERIYKALEQLPLAEATKAGNLESMKGLLEAGFDPNGIGQLSPLVIAAQTENPAAVKLLLEYKANPNGTLGLLPLGAAAKQGNLEIMTLLLDSGADPNAKTPNSYYSFVLNQTMQGYGDKSEAVRLLIEKGADFNQMDKRGLSPFISAVENGEAPYVAIMLAAGADPNAKTKTDDQKPALNLLAEAGTYDTYLTEENRQKTIQLLIDKGVNLNAADALGRTALMGASLGAEKETVELLLKNGANPNLKDNNGHTALYFARQSPVKGIMALLKEHGAKE